MISREQEPAAVLEITQSADGTTIAFERSGSGPPLILVGGAFSSRRSASELVPLLAPHLTVIAYDRRGRGGSTDTPPYAVDREIEDLAALVEVAGGSAGLYGHSSGAALALEATAAGVPVSKLAVYEPPYRSAGAARLPPGYAERVSAAVEAGDRQAAAAIFFREAVGMPEGLFTSMTKEPYWNDMLALAHTIPYENAVVGDGTIPSERFARISVPTLVLSGGRSEERAGDSADELAEIIEGSVRTTVPGEEHAAAAAVVAPLLLDFFRPSRP